MLSPEGPDAAPVYVHKRSILGNTVVIPNETAQDHALSWASRGLLLYMLSMPANWRLNERHLIGQSPKGRDHLRQIVRELEAHGYLRRSAVRGPGGTVSHSIWEVWDTRQEPSEMPPLPETEKPATEKPSEVRTQLQSGVYPWTGKPATEKPATENPSYYKRNNLQSEQRTNKPKNPPIPPAELTEADQPAMVPATDQVPKPDRLRTPPKEPRDPLSTKRLPDDAIPSDLLDCQQLLPEFWAHKKGVRSTRVFERVCRNLRAWSPDERRRSLEASIASAWPDVYPPKPERHSYPQRKSLEQLGAEMDAMPSLF
jgi:hypothetical protein